MKFGVALLLALVSFQYGHGQKIYLAGGVNYSTIITDANVFSFKPGFHLTFGGEKQFTDKISVLHEFMFSKQGGKFNEIDGVLKMNYYNVPILFSYKFDDNWSAQLGPQVGVLAATRDSQDRFRAETDDARTVDFAISAGSQCMVSERLFVRIRLNASLTKAIDFGPLGQHMVLQAGIAYVVKDKTATE